MANDTSAIPRIAAALGAGGVIPFLAVACNSAFAAPLAADLAIRIFIAYGAVILSFLGGIRWGVALQPGAQQGRELTIAVIPSLWAGVCLLLPSPNLAIWGLLAGFVVMGLVDRFGAPAAMPAWMRKLRTYLTIAVAMCHIIVIVTLPT